MPVDVPSLQSKRGLMDELDLRRMRFDEIAVAGDDVVSRQVAHHAG